MRSNAADSSFPDDSKEATRTKESPASAAYSETKRTFRNQGRILTLDIYLAPFQDAVSKTAWIVCLSAFPLPESLCDWPREVEEVEEMREVAAF